MITGIVKGLLLYALQNWAKVAQKGCNEVQIGLSVAPPEEEDGEREVIYTKIVNGEDNEKVEFLEVINKKMDMLGQEAMAKPFIQKSIAAFAEELECEDEEIFVIVYALNAKAKKKSEVRLHLYKKSTPERPVTFEEIFKES